MASFRKSAYYVFSIGAFEPFSNVEQLHERGALRNHPAWMGQVLLIKRIYFADKQGRTNCGLASLQRAMKEME